MAIPSPRVSQLKALVRFEDPNAQITLLEKVIKRVSKSLETMMKELEDLTYWLLCRGVIELEERRKLIHVGKTSMDRKDNRNSILDNRQTFSRSKWDSLHKESYRKEI